MSNTKPPHTLKKKTPPKQKSLRRSFLSIEQNSLSIINLEVPFLTEQKQVVTAHRVPIKIKYKKYVVELLCHNKI